LAQILAQLVAYANPQPKGIASDLFKVAPATDRQIYRLFSVGVPAKTNPSISVIYIQAELYTLRPSVVKLRLGSGDFKGIAFALLNVLLVYLHCFHKLF